LFNLIALLTIDVPCWCSSILDILLLYLFYLKKKIIFNCCFSKCLIHYWFWI